jgi:hypothetical protein
MPWAFMIAKETSPAWIRIADRKNTRFTNYEQGRARLVTESDPV